MKKKGLTNKMKKKIIMSLGIICLLSLAIMCVLVHFSERNPDVEIWNTLAIISFIIMCGMVIVYFGLMSKWSKITKHGNNIYDIIGKNSGAFEMEFSKPYNYKFNYSSFNHFKDEMLKKAETNKCKVHKNVVLNNGTTIDIIAKKEIGEKCMNFFAIIHLKEVTKNKIDEIEKAYWEYLEKEYAELRMMTRTLFIVCVDNKNEYFEEFVNKWVVHEYYDSIIGTGILLNEKEIHILNQKDGPGWSESQTMTKYFARFINLQKSDKI